MMKETKRGARRLETQKPQKRMNLINLTIKEAIMTLMFQSWFSRNAVSWKLRGGLDVGLLVACF